MSRLHDLLYEKNLTNEIDLGLYLKQFSDKIEETLGAMHLGMTVNLKTEKIIVKSERAFLCALILNELLVQIYRHALSDEAHDKAAIEIELTGTDGQVMLNVSDRGVNLPDTFDASKKKSIGLWVVDGMLEKLDGRIQMPDDPGTRFTITFPVK